MVLCTVFASVGDACAKLGAGECALGLAPDGISCYYSPGIQKADIDAVQVRASAGTVVPLCAQERKAEGQKATLLRSQESRFPELNWPGRRGYDLWPILAR